MLFFFVGIAGSAYRAHYDCVRIDNLITTGNLIYLCAAHVLADTGGIEYAQRSRNTIIFPSLFKISFIGTRNEFTNGGYMCVGATGS